MFTKPSLATKILSVIDFLVEQATQGFLQWEEEAGPWASPEMRGNMKSPIASDPGFSKGLRCPNRGKGSTS